MRAYILHSWILCYCTTADKLLVDSVHYCYIMLKNEENESNNNETAGGMDSCATFDTVCLYISLKNAGDACVLIIVVEIMLLRSIHMIAARFAMWMSVLWTAMP